MTWNSDVLKSYNAQLIGAGVAWESYEYRLPFSKYVVTNCRNEVWHVRKPEAVYHYISGQGHQDLHKLLASIETPLELAAKAKHRAELVKRYESWKTRLARLASHIMNDGQTQAYIKIQDDCVHEFKSLGLVIDNFEDVYIAFNEDANLCCGYVCKHSFTGVPSFHKYTKRYWGFPA